MKKFLERIGVLEETVDNSEDMVITSKSSVQTPSIIPNLGSDIVDTSMVAKIKNIINSTLRQYKKGNDLDYISLMDSIEQIKSTIPDEKTRFISALTIARTMNPTLSKETLIKSIEYYLQCLDVIKSDFVKSNEDKRKNEIAIKETEIETINSNIERLKEQKIKIDEEINTLTSSSTRITNEIEQSKKKIDDADIIFNSEYSKKKQELIEHKEKINNYIT